MWTHVADAFDTLSDEALLGYLTDAAVSTTNTS
jgi:hypothetical protein